MQILPRSKIFYVSPWLLAAATTLLVLIVVTFTLTNIRREEHLMTSAMLQKADTLIRIIHSGSKSAFFSDFRRDAWKIEAWQVYVQRIIQHVAEDPDVQFLAVIDDKNRIIAHNNEKIIGQHLDFVLPDNISEDQGKKPPLKYSITTNEGYGRVFEAVRLFFPYRPFMQPMMQNSFVRPLGRDPLAQQRMMLRKFHEKVDIEQLDSGTFYVLVGLDMSGYDQSLRRIKLQTLVLSLIMLLVGLGGWLSLAAVQGFRVSQKTLQEMKLFTSLLLAKLPVGIIASDNDGYITTCNDSAARMIGTSGNNLVGESVEAALPKPFSDFFVDIAAADVTQAPIPGLEKEVTRMENDRKFHFFCQIISVEGERSEPQGWVLLISDLTQIKDLEKEMRESERLAAVGRMAAGVAHEVRNPLSSIKGLALLLKGKFSENSNERETAGLLVEQVERMNRTVSELLSFARPAPLSFQKVSLNEFLKDILRLIDTDARSNNIQTHLELASDLQDIAADPDRLNQVFINLLLNGVQAMESGGELIVTAKNGSDDKTVEIKVHDNGCGISQKHMTQLFYPYFTTKATGTGIGLAISQKIINDHKGSIKIDSVEGSGTTVTVVLPVNKSNEEV